MFSTAILLSLVCQNTALCGIRLNLAMLCKKRVQPFQKRQILDSSKLKEFVDDNSNFVENGRKLSKQMENNVGKGEIVGYEQFLLFPQWFQRTYKADT